MKTFVGSSPLALSSAVPATMDQEPAPDARRQMMLRGSIAGTLLQFAAPTIMVVIVQTLVSIRETYFVGFLETDSLAGVALILPVRRLHFSLSPLPAEPTSARGDLL